MTHIHAPWEDPVQAFYSLADMDARRAGGHPRGMNPIQRERKRRRWSQERLALAAGFSQGMISRIESGQINPPLSTLRRLAEAMGIEVAEMMRATNAEDIAAIAAPDEAEADSAASVVSAPREEVERLADRVTAAALRPGCNVWRVRDRSMQLAGYMPDDRLLVVELADGADSMLQVGEPVIAQVISPRTGEAATVFRRYDPPFLTAASLDPADRPTLGIDAHIRGRVVASWRLPG